MLPVPIMVLPVYGQLHPAPAYPNNLAIWLIVVWMLGGGVPDVPAQPPSGGHRGRAGRPAALAAEGCCDEVGDRLAGREFTGVDVRSVWPAPWWNGGGWSVRGVPRWLPGVPAWDDADDSVPGSRSPPPVASAPDQEEPCPTRS
ncbi:MAG: hypothetical protein JWP46_4095 [Modestobacter sp.]|nr:hypothetical protein [Modestobacter sp.]